MIMARKAHVDSVASPDPLATATAAAELRYKQTSSEFDLISREEEARRLRVKLLISQHEAHSANARYEEECAMREAVLTDRRTETEALQVELAEARAENEEIQRSLKKQAKQCESLKTELASMESVSADSNKVLSEKLALAREIATLRPELEDLRSTLESQRGLLSEKLSLQRRVSSMQAELDNEKQNVERAKARQGKQQNRHAGYEDEIEELKLQLEEERKKHEEDKKSSRKEYLDDIAEFRKELELVEEERERLERAAASGGHGQKDTKQVEDLREKLSNEKKERQKIEKQLSQSNSDFEAQTAVLEDKLSQFRTKLKTTKDKLRETETELREARSLVPSNSTAGPSRQRNPRKRSAVQIDPDAIGTPGDGPAVKRTKRASSVVGEKSTFSITPFLNRTSNINVSEDRDVVVGSVEDDEDVASPSAAHDQQPSPANKKPLAQASAGKANANPQPPSLGVQGRPRKRTATSSSLEKVTEEQSEEEEENAEPTATMTAPVFSEKPKAMRQLKASSMRPKSLSSFASFRETSLAPENGQKKKRKLAGGPGPKTLFDEDGEDDGASKPKMAGGRRAFGAFSGKLGGIGNLAAKKKGPLKVAGGDGFVFSPLKKDRKAAATISAAAS